MRDPDEIQKAVNFNRRMDWWFREAQPSYQGDIVNKWGEWFQDLADEAEYEDRDKG